MASVKQFQVTFDCADPERVARFWCEVNEPVCRKGADQPTKAIWTTVVAEHGSCFRSGCDTPATEVELAHRTRWPHGPTEPENP